MPLTLVIALIRDLLTKKYVRKDTVNPVRKKDTEVVVWLSSSQLCVVRTHTRISAALPTLQPIGALRQVINRV